MTANAHCCADTCYGYGYDAEGDRHDRSTDRESHRGIPLRHQWRERSMALSLRLRRNVDRPGRTPAEPANTVLRMPEGPQAERGQEDRTGGAGTTRTLRRGHHRSPVRAIRGTQQGRDSRAEGVLVLSLRLRHREGGLRFTPAPGAGLVLWVPQPRADDGHARRTQLQGRRDHVSKRPQPYTGCARRGASPSLHRLRRASRGLVAPAHGGPPALRTARYVHAGLLAGPCGLRPSVQALPRGVRP